MRDLVRHTAEHEALDARHPAIADDDAPPEQQPSAVDGARVAGPHLHDVLPSVHVEVPALVDTLTTNKADFLKDGGSLKKYYRYRKAIKKGVVKVMSKMGISTIQSYRGAQIFEAIGLNEEFVSRYFDKTASRVGGSGSWTAR